MEGARIPVALSAAACKHVRAIAHRENASLFQVVLAAFQMVLSVWCQQARFVVGTPSHNRQRAEVEAIVGFFVSTVPILADFSGNPTLRRALSLVRQSALNALAHADVSFDRLVALAPSIQRAPGVPPLVQALFVWQQALIPEVNLALRAYEEDTRTSKFDLTVSLRPERDGIVGHVEFNSDLFAATTLRRMFDQLEPILAAMDDRPDTKLGSALSTDSNDPDWSCGPMLHTSNTTADAYARTVALCADEPAVSTPSRQLTYRELDDDASALAAQLRLDGKPMGLCLATGVEAIVSIVAAWKCRSPYVPLDPSWPAARIDHILEETGARICLGRNFAVDVEQLLIPDVERVSVNRIEARPTDLAYIIYTSGSTGEPKGVMIPHRGVAHLEAALDSAVYAASVRRTGRIGIFGALSFDTTVKQIVRFLRGDCLCPIPQGLKASPKRLARHLSRAALDVVDMTPSWLRILLDAGLELRPNSGSPMTFLLGGEPIDPALWHDLALRQARAEATFINVYGPTEATVDATWTPLSPSREPSIGRPLPASRVYLLDEDLRLVLPGFVGEIAIAGDGVAVGYLGRPEQTAEAFRDLTLGGRPERVYRTGDFARLRDDGALVFLGRRDRQIKRHGQRLELGEIEAALYTHPALSEAAVVELDGRLEVFCVSRGAPTTPTTHEDVAAHVKNLLPRGFWPDAYHWRRALPRNTSGKIDYTALAATELEATPSPVGAAIEIQGEHQRAIAQIWLELLGSPPANSRADFFACGGDSLLGLQLLARIERRFGVALDVAWLASNPTLESLAVALAPEASQDPVIWLRRGSTRVSPLAFVHATGGDVACYRGLASLLEDHFPIAGLPAPPVLPADLNELAGHHVSTLADVIDRDVILGGWSLGGVVALEVARRLRQRGVQVPLVLLLDSRLPRSNVPVPIDSRLDSVDERLAERLTTSSERLLALWRDHEMEPYDGDVLLVKAASEDNSHMERWRALLPRLAVVRTSVEHHDMMRPPQVAKVAQIVGRALQSAHRPYLN